ncbi:MarR family transcriptional regulator [Maricaulis sp.]|uniref:MarR family transcriptional regulator n=1 Tax=Maricaulis sp. TaxID=1486257 RepID=UPI003A954564
MLTAEYSLLRGILATIARQTFTPDTLYALVVPNSNAKTNAIAFNLCDGSRTQSEIATAAGVDKGNLSKRIQRWVDAGIIIKIPHEKSWLPLHLYPIPETMIAAHSNEAGK